MPELVSSLGIRVLLRSLIFLAVFAAGMMLGFGLCAQSAGISPANSPWSSLGLFLFFWSAAGFGITLMVMLVTAIIMLFRK